MKYETPTAGGDPARQDAQSQRILFITRAYGTQAGGMERLSYELVETLRSYPGVTVTVITPPQRTAAAAGHVAVRIVRSCLFALTHIPVVLIKARQHDHVHLGDPLLSLVGWLVKKIYRQPVSVTCHGLDLIYQSSLYQLYLKLFFRDLDRYHCISHYTESLLAQHQVKGQSLVLTPGINDHYHEPSIKRPELDRLLGRSTAQKIILLTSGRLVKRKGHEWFIHNVLPHLPNNVIYVIAGDGPERELIKQATPNASIVRLGKVSESTLKVLYNTVDAFVQPNIHIKNDAEGFGLVLLEAASCGLPVFAANTDGIPDAIQTAKNGVLLEAGGANAWIEVLTHFAQHPLPRNREAREYTLKNFSWTSLLPHYLYFFTTARQKSAAPYSRS